MARQLHSPVSTPPTTGPMASAKPEVAAHTPIARLRLLASGYRCRSIDKVPGSLAAAPRPITARPAIRTWTFGASADRTEPAQNTPAPVSMTFLRPSSSPIIPQASMMLAKVRAYAPTTHCRSAMPACRLVWMSPSATLTTVLSRKVRNSSVHSVASAIHWLPRVTIPWSPDTAPAWRANRAALPQPAELHAAGTEPPGISLNRPHRLASPTFQVPSWYTDVPFCPLSKVVVPDTML